MADNKDETPKRPKKHSKGKPRAGKQASGSGTANIAQVVQDSGNQASVQSPPENISVAVPGNLTKTPMFLIHSQSPDHRIKTPNAVQTLKTAHKEQAILSPTPTLKTNFVEGCFDISQVEREFLQGSPCVRKCEGDTALSRGGFFNSNFVDSNERTSLEFLEMPIDENKPEKSPEGEMRPVVVFPFDCDPSRKVPMPRQQTSCTGSVQKNTEIVSSATTKDNIKKKRSKNKTNPPATEVTPIMAPSESVFYFDFSPKQEKNENKVETIEKKILDLNLGPSTSKNSPDEPVVKDVKPKDSVFYFMKPDTTAEQGEKVTPERKTPKRRQRTKKTGESKEQHEKEVHGSSSRDVDSPAGKKTRQEMNPPKVNTPNTPSTAQTPPKVHKPQTPSTAKTRTPHTPSTPQSPSGSKPVTPKSLTKSAKKRTLKTPDEKDGEIRQFAEFLNAAQLELMESYGVLFQAVIRINQKCPNEAYLPAPDKGQDYLIENFRDRNRALEGDVVFAIAKPTKSKFKPSANPLAVVVGIKERVHSRVCIGSLSAFYNKAKKFATLIPNDNRLPKLRVEDRWLPKEFMRRPLEFQEVLYAADIAEWNDVRYAVGTNLRFIGVAGSASAETKALLMKYRLDVTPYPEHFNEFFPSPDFTIPQEELARREDMRKHCVFTIDPETAKDLDDAVSLEIHEDGSKTVGVHIADVTYFLKEDTELDTMVADRATTIYLVDNVYHMLPRDLCGLCSLTPGADKLTFSVFWKFSPEGDIQSTWFRRSVINSVAQLSYEQAQGVLEGQESMLPHIGNGFSEKDVERSIIEMNKLAEKLRAARVESGALRIDQTKVSFILDPEKKVPIAFITQEQKAAHKLIEEFMLLANTSVAELLQSKLPSLAMLRRHDPPLDEYLARVQAQMERFGIPLDITTSKTLQASLTKLSGGGEDEKAHLMVINAALAKPMTRALYFCSEFAESAAMRRHYALSVDTYTHFTSPIRRYADVMVHRQLSAALGMADISHWTSDYVQKIAANCNTQKYNAKLAGEASSELYFALLVGEQGSVLVDAVISTINPNFFECIILATGFQVKVYHDKVDGKVTASTEKGCNEWTIEWSDGQVQKIDVFSVVSAELTRGKGCHLDARLLPPATLQNQQ